LQVDLFFCGVSDSSQRSKFWTKMNLFIYLFMNLFIMYSTHFCSYKGPVSCFAEKVLVTANDDGVSIDVLFFSEYYGMRVM
jgi:hypothetical protein